MDLIQTFKDKARQRPQRIVFPEARDERILETAQRIAAEGIATPILVGDPDELANQLSEVKGIEFGNNREDAVLDRFADIYAEARDMRVGIARKLVRKPLSFGGMMVRTGAADGMVAGVASATSLVIQAATLTIGFQEGITSPSSFFIMIIPPRGEAEERVLVFADSAVAIQPEARELAEIAALTGDNAAAFLDLDPKIAFLSFSTHGSASHADVEKVQEALTIAREMRPEYAMDGELQLDAAIVPRVAAKKVAESPVAGAANVLIFPDLDAGNIGYKLVQYLAGAQAIGPILQGFDRPVNDMSRGASVDDLVAVTAITAIMARERSA